MATAMTTDTAARIPSLSAGAAGAVGAGIMGEDITGEVAIMAEAGVIAGLELSVMMVVF